MIHRGLSLLLASLVFFVAPVATGNAQELAANTGVLDVTLPSEATISINGTNYGDRRHFEIKPLESSRLYAYEVVAKIQERRGDPA